MKNNELIKDIEDIIYLSRFLTTENDKETRQVVKYLKRVKKSLKKKERYRDD